MNLAKAQPQLQLIHTQLLKYLFLEHLRYLNIIEMQESHPVSTSLSSWWILMECSDLRLWSSPKICSLNVFWREGEVQYSVCVDEARSYFAAGVADAGGRPDAGQAHHRHPLPCSCDEWSLGPEPVPALVDEALEPPQVLAKPHLYSTVQYSTVQYSTVQPHLHLGECELVARVSALVGHVPGHRQPQRGVGQHQIRATVEFSNFDFGLLV